MLFNSIDFLLFFPVVVLIYFIIPNKIKYLWLLVASYYFYMSWDAKYALLLLSSTLITYLSGLFIDKINSQNKEEAVGKILKKTAVIISVVLNLGILFFFKYFTFATATISRIFGLIHVELNVPAFDIILPVGISFYTFQALSYTIDVYRGEIKAEKNIFRYALFVSFFPQLVAGPIERSRNLLSQLSNPMKFNFDNFREGLLLMLWGFFLKIVMADRISIFVDNVYGNYSGYPGVYLLIATVLFGIQIYCDFAGYSTIALGSAKVLGINLSDNFNTPYLACSVAEFWRRWHISLTSWFKDYVYIPLGGNKKGKARKYLNIMIVFLFSGIWHGAGISYIVWGGLNGIYQIIGELIKPIGDKIIQTLKLDKKSVLYRISGIICTVALIDFTWIFFRAERMMDAMAIIKSIFTSFKLSSLTDGSIYECGLDKKNFMLMIITLFILLAADYCKKRGIVIRNEILKQNYWVRLLLIVIGVMVILIFGKYGPAYDSAKFIYFQF